MGDHIMLNGLVDFYFKIFFEFFLNVFDKWLEQFLKNSIEFLNYTIVYVIKGLNILTERNRFDLHLINI